MKLIIAIILCCLATFSFSQSPNEISYQAVLRDTDGKILAEKTVNFKLVLHESSAIGKTVYSESHQVKTNRNGLVYFVIGKGKKLTGDFSKIMWGKGSFFMESLVDEKGGTNFKSIGTTKLMSVPYALHSNTADSLTNNKYQKQIDSLERVSLSLKNEDNILANKQVTYKKRADSLLNLVKKNQAIGLIVESQKKQIDSLTVTISKINNKELKSRVSLQRKKIDSLVKLSISLKNEDNILANKQVIYKKRADSLLNLVKKNQAISLIVESQKKQIDSLKKVLNQIKIENSNNAKRTKLDSLIYVLNTPLISNIKISPSKITAKTDKIQLEYSFISVLYKKNKSKIVWYNNGKEIAKSKSELKERFVKGDKIKVEVEPINDVKSGKKISYTAAVSNSVPTIHNMHLSFSGNIGDNITLTYDYKDADNDSDKTIIKWYLDGVLKLENKSFMKTKGLFDYEKQYVVKVEIFPSDGDYTSVAPLVIEKTFKTPPKNNSTTYEYTGLISTDITFKNDKIHLIKDIVSMKAGSTLTIEPGAIIKAQRGAVLIIPRGAKIIAKGTREKPIIFTSVRDNIKLGQKKGTNLASNASRLWNGLAILGKAPISIKSGDENKFEINGSTRIYGGLKTDDNSGVLEYVSIRHAGTYQSEYLHPLTLAGVGSKTSIKNIEIYSCVGGFSLRGGTVNISNILLNFSGLYISQAYSGVVNNLLNVYRVVIEAPEGIKEGKFTIQNSSITGDRYLTLKGNIKGIFSNIVWTSLRGIDVYASFYDNNNCAIKPDAYYQLINGNLKFSKFNYKKTYEKSNKITVYTKAICKGSKENSYGNISSVKLADEAVKAAKKIVSDKTATGADKSKFKGWTISEIK